ncbi:hypothetical protein J6590_013219 [Homalodisca vitripennis]|nr:hypothetical protein J6590_013219 [Homalodisca vitripennis]
MNDGREQDTAAEPPRTLGILFNFQTRKTLKRLVKDAHTDEHLSKRRSQQDVDARRSVQGRDAHARQVERRVLWIICQGRAGGYLPC